MITAKISGIIFALTIVFVVPAAAQTAGLREGLDYSAAFGTRTVPLGLAVSGTVGYGKVLWGTNATEADVLYGYVRPSLKLQTSGTVTILDTRLDVSPIAPLVVSLGHNDSFRLADFSKVDCAGNACKNHLSRNYLRVQGVVGAHGLFLVGILRYDWIRSSVTDRGFYDEAVSILGAIARDRSRTGDVILGYTVVPNHVVGAMWASAAMRDSGQTQHLFSAFYRHTRGDWNFTGGAGTYRSSIQAASPTVFISVDWTGIKGAGL